MYFMKYDYVTLNIQLFKPGAKYVNLTRFYLITCIRKIADSRGQLGQTVFDLNDFHHLDPSFTVPTLFFYFLFIWVLTSL